MIVRATSDLHLRRDNAEFVFRALSQLEADARQTGGTTLILGDVFDQPETVHMPTWNRLRRMLRHWPGPVIVLAGNHDQYAYPESAVEGLHGGRCQVVSTPTGSAELGVILPYVPEGSWARELAAVVAPVGAPPFVWCHAGFRGAYLNNMRRDRDGVPVSAVGDRWVITGHYHLPQAVGRVIYTGSPIEHSFSEEGQAKGWLRWADLHSNPVPTRVAFDDTGAPRHRTVLWQPEVGPPPPIERGASDKVRVRTGATVAVAKKAAAQLEAAGLGGVPILARPDEAASRGVVAAGMTREEQVIAYLQAGDRDAEGMIEWANAHALGL